MDNHKQVKSASVQQTVTHVPLEGNHDQVT